MWWREKKILIKALIKEPQIYSKLHFISYKMWNLVLNLKKFPDVTLLNVSLFWCSILSPVNLSCFPECILINVEETKSKHLQPVNTTARMLYIRYHKNIFISILFKYMKKNIYSKYFTTQKWFNVHWIEGQFTWKQIFLNWIWIVQNYSEFHF